MAWVDIEAEKMDANSMYFQVAEGDNRVQLLTHCAPLAQVWTGSKYEIAEEGAKNISIKGVCWLLQDGVVKQAKLPYTVVKQVRDLMGDADYAFTEFPMPRMINIKAKNAGTKDVEYSVIPSPKETEISQEVLGELATKPTPEEIIEKLKGRVAATQPEEVKDIPF